LTLVIEADFGPVVLTIDGERANVARGGRLAFVFVVRGDAVRVNARLVAAAVPRICRDVNVSYARRIRLLSRTVETCIIV
jgi:hypothetical protein